MRRSKPEIQKYIESVQNSAPSPREKSMKGFLIAKLYYEAKEYDQAKRCVSSYINVQERDPKAHRFLGLLYEIEGNVEKSVGCYKRSLELNPTQKDLVLKIAELICTMNVTDGRAEYWVERAAKLFPGNPVIYRLKEQLLNLQGEAGWNRLFDLIQSELFARPDDVHVNIRLVELFRSNKRLDEAVIHCLKPERRALRNHLEWCSCVVQVLKEYLSAYPSSDKDKNWRIFNKELLLAHSDVVFLTLSTRDVPESRLALENFDQALLSVKPHANGTDDLSVTFSEMRGHYYMHAGTQLLKMAQHSDVQWKALLEPAALCYLLAFQVPWNKQIKADESSYNFLEGLACDRRSQSGHLLLTLSHGHDDFLTNVTETFANKSGQGILLKFLFEDHISMENSFLGTDDIGNVNYQSPDLNDLRRYDQGAVRMHNGSLQHLTWLGLQWEYMSTLPTFHKWLKQLFPRLPLETSRIESNNPESVCILDLEVFLLAVVYTSYHQLQGNYTTSHDRHRPRCLPLPICKQLFTDKQRSWWDAVYNLTHKMAQPGTATKLRLVIQHELNTLRVLEKHGLQPALLIHWARSLCTTGNNLNSFYDQRDYMFRCIHYWKKVLPLLDLVKQKKSIPEPVDPLFKHFHSKDIKLSEVRDLEDEAGIAFARVDIIEGKIDDAILALESIKSVHSCWHLALIYQRKGEDLENEIPPTEEQEEYLNCIQKYKSYLIKILDEVSTDPSLTGKLPVPIESVEEMLDEAKKILGEVQEVHSPNFRDTQSFMSASAIKHSTPSPTKFSVSPNKAQKSLSKTPPPWAEDQKSLIEKLVQQVEALKKEVHELRMNSSNTNVSSQRWAEGFGADPATDGFHLAQSYYDPLTVSTTGHPGYYAQSPAYNPQQLLRPVANVTPTKTNVYPVSRMTTQQHMYAMHTPPVQNSAIVGPALRFESPATNILSPQPDDYYNYSLPPNTANPALPEPGYFTKATFGSQQTKSDGSKIEFGKSSFVQPIPNEGPKLPQFTAPMQSTPSSTFKFNSNFKSNDGDFTFSSNQVGTPSSAGNECLLRLLTSDKTIPDQGKPSASFENAVDSRNMFRFSEKSFVNNFGDGTIQNQDKSNAMFGQRDNEFHFQNSEKKGFVPPAFDMPSKEEHNQSHGSESASDFVAEEDGPHFEPVVPLPEKVEVKTGEEEEQEMFCNRAKLFRFDADSKEWKERGLGNVKILRHKVNGKIRLLMRRDQILKICANHYINAEMKLKPLAASDKSFVWHAYDYADEMPKSEQLAIRFKTVEEATRFKTKFEEAQKLLQITEDSSSIQTQSIKAELKAKPISLDVQFGLKPGEWRCDACAVKNKDTTVTCVSCATPNQNSKNSRDISTKDTKSLNTGASSISMSASAFSFSKDTLNSKSSSNEQLTKNREQWICSKCSTKNAIANKQCITCHPVSQNDGKSALSFTLKSTADLKSISGTQGGSFGSAQSASSFKFVTSETGPSKDFGGLFAKKEGQWDCSVCIVRNEAGASKCVSCENPKPTSSGNVTGRPIQPSNFSFNKAQNDSLEARFQKKEGQWDCSVCLVRNEGSAIVCVACNTQNPNAKSVPTTSVPTTSDTKSTFGSLFAKKEGQWDCSVCIVRNEANASKCVSCENPNPTSSGNTTGPTIQQSNFSFNKAQNGSLEARFQKKEGQWDCSVCLVRNEGSAIECVACNTQNPNAKSVPTTSVPTSSVTKSAFTFGLKTSSEAFTPPSTVFKCNFAGKDVKFGTSDDKPAFSLKPTNSNEETKSEGFSFTMPFNSSSFKFGLKDSNTKDEHGNEASSDVTGTLGDKGVSTESDTGLQAEESKQSGELVFSQTAGTFSFSQLSKNSEGFAFGKTDPNFKGFSRAGEKLFTSINVKGEQANSAEHERLEELYKTEDRDDIHFEPIVNLPEKVELVTGEEDETVLYSQRVKLFRFDAETSQWKERGVGNMKILKNEVNGKLRMLMRRDQVLKVCANHLITTTMNLKRLSGSDRAWMWMASDFSDGDAKLEQLAAKFKTPEQAEDFKSKFEECQRLLLDIPLQTPHKLVDTGRTAHLIKKAEEMKSGLKDLKTFLTDQVKPGEEDKSLSDSVDPIKKTPEYSEATYEWDNYDMRAGALEGNLDDSVYASPLANSPEKSNLFRFGESTTGFNFSFQPSPSPGKSPTKINQSRVSVGTDDESDVTQEDERDGQYFDPVVPLPDLVEVTSGEENEQTLFCNRAKLYRFDKDTNQWKERGIGDLKILQNYDDKSARVVMRRDQVLKLCANHRITPDIHLKPMTAGSQREWAWTARDFAEGDDRVECFAVRFKLQEVADLFKEAFEEAKVAQSKGCLLAPFSSRVTSPKASPCGKAAVAILEETTRERTDLPSVTSPASEAESNTSATSEKTPTAVVSPPKFVFGSDVVKNIFGTEKKGFTFGSPSGAGTMFGFSFNSSKTSNKEQKTSKPSPTPPINSKDSSVALEKPSQQVLQNPTVSSSATASSQPQPQGPARAKSSGDLGSDSSSDVVIVYELTPTAAQRALAEQLLLPPTFFCYKNKPGYVSDEGDVDDEDFESAVKNLNGQLYQEHKRDKSRQAASDNIEEPTTGSEKECVIVWEKTPTAKEKVKAEHLKLPPTFFCGVSSDTDDDKENPEDYDSAVRKMKESEETEDTKENTGTATASITLSTAQEKPDTSAPEPVDLSTKTEEAKPDSTSTAFNFSFGLSSGSGISFADLATDNEEFAFGSKDNNFQWANTGAAVFTSMVQNKKAENKGENDDEVVHSDDVHFEPIVSLPEVDVKSGEEDEEILFKERVKLYRWDRDINQWKERGVGELKILFHQEKKYYRVLMRRDQVLKVCANHMISAEIKLAPLNTSNNALVWAAQDFSDGEGRFEQLAARFKNQELADSFQKIFEECQRNLQMS
ncbi:ranBP2-like and GRIP domain-containing protein 4 [Hyla sarda]|uniref:ranBP2-like and GRIP domain-containing protein 4 n=2 Tax=Hyla sarda TaxID=327740 RepID=UPI0024C3192D|nr:ranBP2-like and GRIP domain-containing protein 4 [Hyla sarda]